MSCRKLSAKEALSPRKPARLVFAGRTSTPRAAPRLATPREKRIRPSAPRLPERARHLYVRTLARQRAAAYFKTKRARQKASTTEKGRPGRRLGHGSAEALEAFEQESRRRGVSPSISRGSLSTGPHRRLRRLHRAGFRYLPGTARERSTDGMTSFLEDALTLLEDEAPGALAGKPAGLAHTRRDPAPARSKGKTPSATPAPSPAASCDSPIARMLAAIKTADAVVVGAGSELSTSAGFTYGGRALRAMVQRL